MQYLPTASGLRLTAPAARLGTVAEFLSRWMDRPVVDMTGLTGQYELELPFLPEVVPTGFWVPDGAKKFTEPGPTLFESVKALGLRLEARKVPIEMLTVVSAERAPTEN
jgi:uncharacterized protein (TIGR03435 family)